MLVAKSEKTGLGNTVVLYWDSNQKNYRINVFEDEFKNRCSKEPISGLALDDREKAIETFDAFIWNNS